MPEYVYSESGVSCLGQHTTRTISESISGGNVVRRRGDNRTGNMTIVQKGSNQLDSPSVLHRSPDYARYLIDVTLSIVKSIQADLHSQYNKLISEQYWDDPALGKFIGDLFKQSRVSYSVLLVGLLYLLRFRNSLGRRKQNQQSHSQSQSILQFHHTHFLLLMFVTSLLLSNKFLHDRHSSNSAWSSYSGFPLVDINRGEIFFLNVIEHDLLVEKEVFHRWVNSIFHPSNLEPYCHQISHPVGRVIITNSPIDVQRVPRSSIRFGSAHPFRYEV